MKILFVRTYCPNPIIYGSEMRGGRFINYFRQKGRVDLLTLTAPTRHADTDYIKEHFDHYYYFDQRGEHKRLSPIEKLVNLLPWQIAGYYAKDFQKQLNGIIEQNQYDLIFIFKLEPIFYFLNLPKTWRDRTVIDFDDILSSLYLNYYRNKLTAAKNGYSLRMYELRALKNFRRAFICSQDALNRIPVAYREKTGIIPNVFAWNPHHFQREPGPEKRLLFVGSLDYFPNTDGLRWFCSTVWPKLLREHPDLILTVVGKTQRDAASVYSLLGSPQNVEVAVNVPTVLPYYSNCFATIVPLLNGSGTRLKILESAAYGRPVLSTLKGVEGLDFKSGEDIFVFEDSQSFLSGYEALRDRARYSRITEDAVKVIQKQYSPEAFQNSMDANWRMIVKKEYRVI